MEINGHHQSRQVSRTLTNMKCEISNENVKVESCVRSQKSSLSCAPHRRINVGSPLVSSLRWADHHRSTPSSKYIPLWCCLLIFCALIINGAKGIKLRRFDVPVKLKMGANTTLTCHYELEHDRLYAVKWYRNEKEFYRFVPGERPDERKQSFQVDGIHVDLVKSTDRTVALRDVSPRTAGNFKCEASVEDSFQSVAMERKMSVVSAQTNGHPFVARHSTSSSSPSNLIQSIHCSLAFILMLVIVPFRLHCYS